MNGKGIPEQGNGVFFKVSNKNHTLKSDLLKIITECIFNAKIIIGFLNNVNPDQCASGNKSTSDIYVMISFEDQRRLLANVFIFLPENSIELGDRLRLILGERESANDSNNLGEEMVAITVELLGIKVITTS